MSIDALYDYLDGTDPILVAAGARVLDQNAYENGQISWEALQETLNECIVKDCHRAIFSKKWEMCRAISTNSRRCPDKKCDGTMR